MAHTEGPLEIRGPASDGDYAIIAQIDGVTCVIGEAFRQVNEGECIAARDNARLWASAPDLLRQRDELAAERDRAIQLAESRRVGWEGAIAIQEALEKQRDELAAALRATTAATQALLDAWEGYEMLAALDIAVQDQAASAIEQGIAALALLPAEAGEAGEPALPGRPG